jgi:hypothetical protein
LLGSSHEELKVLVVVQQAGIGVGLEGAGSRGVGEVGKADFLKTPARSMGNRVLAFLEKQTYESAGCPAGEMGLGIA